MAKYIKMRTRIDESPEAWVLVDRLGVSIEEVVFRLYRLNCWIAEQGTHGKIRKEHRSAVDFIFRCRASDSLEEVGWMREENGVLLFSGFTTAHAERKSLGRKIRKKVLEAGECALCLDTRNLEVDHDLPISRGGSSELDNLVALCRSCNRKKGTKTLEEFKNDR